MPSPTRIKYACHRHHDRATVITNSTTHPPLPPPPLPSQPSTPSPGTYVLTTTMYPEDMEMPLILSGSQDWLVNNNNGYGFHDFSFNLQRYHLHQQQGHKLLQDHHHQQQQQCLLHFQNQHLQQKNDQSLSIASENNWPYPTTTTTSASTIIDHGGDNHRNLFLMSFSQTLASQFANQAQEIDAYVSPENERLKLAQSKHEVASTLKKLEEKATILLRQKEEEIARAKTRSTELDQLLMRLELENQLWRRAAAENEAVITSINTTIHQLTKISAESCSSSFEEGTFCLTCRRCKCRESSVLFLPCRHLCSCKECEGFLRHCPVCKSVKQATLEALFSFP